MNKAMSELVRGYAAWCVHCWDYYAVQQRDGSYRPVYQPLSLSRLADHLSGRSTLGTYVLDQVGTCSFAVFDADMADGLERLVRLSGELAAQGISLVVEASRRGGHLWVWLSQPMTALVVRAWLLPYAVAYGVELYPKQDGLRPGGVGSLVRLPLGVHRQSGLWYPFMEVGPGGVWPVGETVAECAAWLCAHAMRVAVPVCEVDDVEERGAMVATPIVRVGERPGRGAIVAWCRSQDMVEVIGSYTHLDRHGVGRCPLPGHHYRGDVRPSFQVFGGGEPHWYCYTWKRAGDLFDFLRLYHGLSVQEAWQRLQAGTLL
jgi:hypothetical protein